MGSSREKGREITKVEIRNKNSLQNAKMQLPRLYSEKNFNYICHSPNTNQRHTKKQIKYAKNEKPEK